MEYKKYIEENEEIRSWFKVSANRKKVWNVQLVLLEELKRICEKHNIKYYAEWWTLLWAIRHKWFIPRDDDMDFLMFRDDYEKFLKIAEKELPKHIKIKRIWLLYWIQVVNINTTAIWMYNPEFLCNKDNYLGIRIDIFPIDYASKYVILNKLKSLLLRFLYAIVTSLITNDNDHNKIPTWKNIILKIDRFIFKKINIKKISHLYEKISKKILFKWQNVIAGRCPWKYYPKNIFDKSHSVVFENTTICIPSWYDKYLKLTYWDYMTPVIFEWGHSCYYSVDLPYKDVIEWFDKSELNEQNFNNCKSLFRL